MTGKFCAACVDAPATLFADVWSFGSEKLQGRWLCDACWQFAKEHDKETPRPPDGTPSSGRRHGGGGYLPNADEQLNWSKE